MAWRTPEQIAAEADLQAARAKKRGYKAARSSDTRRKVLAGVALLKEVGRRATDERFMTEVREMLAAHLDRDIDRRLFDDILALPTASPVPIQETPEIEPLQLQDGTPASVDRAIPVRRKPRRFGD